MIKKKCFYFNPILELDYECPKCGIVESIKPTTNDGNQTIKCGKCDTHIRLNGETVDKPAHIIRKAEIDKEMDALKTDSFLPVSSNNDYSGFGDYSSNNGVYQDKQNKIRKLYLEKENIGSIKVLEYCRCGCHMSTSS